MSYKEISEITGIEEKELESLNKNNWKIKRYIAKDKNYKIKKII